MYKLFGPVEEARAESENREVSKRRKERSVTVSGDLIAHTAAESRAIAASMAHGPTGYRWEKDEQGKVMTYRAKDHAVSVHAEEGEELALVAHLIEDQGTDAAIALMYVLSCLSPNFDPNERCSEWIDTAEAARSCGLLTREGKAQKHEARMKITKALIFGERATVRGKRNYRGDAKKEQASYVDSVVWAVTDAEYLDESEEQGGLPSTGRKLPLNPICPPVRCYVQLSARWRELLTDPDWRQYLTGFRAIASIPAGKPHCHMARAIGIGFMCECRMQIEAAAKDIKDCMNGEDASSMRARKRRYWLKSFGFDVDAKTYQDNPARLVEHWAQAIELLSGALEDGGAELIARRGEAANASTMLGAGRERGKGWAQEWLEEEVRFTPGPALAPQILAFVRGEVLPPNLARVFLNRPGRPTRPRAKMIRLPASPLLEAPAVVQGA